MNPAEGDPPGGVFYYFRGKGLEAMGQARRGQTWEIPRPLFFLISFPLPNQFDLLLAGQQGIDLSI